MNQPTNTRKRWQSIYAGADPFRLVHEVKQSLRCCCHERTHPSDGQIKYLWIHLGPPIEPGNQQGSDRHLTCEEWLDVLDESASIGIRSVIISVGRPLAEQADLLSICSWAQSTHQMIVGVHLYGMPLSAEDAELLARLDVGRTRLFLDGEFFESGALAEHRGIRLFNADGLSDEVVSPKCELPGQMTCVGSKGTLYTCGLVLGDEQYKYGHVFERKLSAVMEDETLPHEIPEGAAQGTHRCNGCPPLMAQKSQESVR